ESNEFDDLNAPSWVEQHRAAAPALDEPLEDDEDEIGAGEEIAPADSGLRAADSELTPMGNRRSAVTESEEIDYRLPPPDLPAPAPAPAGARPSRRRARPPRPRRGRPGPARGAPPLRRRGEAGRHRVGTARQPLRAPARPGDEGRQGRPAQGRSRLRAGLD